MMSTMMTPTVPMMASMMVMWPAMMWSMMRSMVVFGMRVKCTRYGMSQPTRCVDNPTNHISNNTPVMVRWVSPMVRWGTSVVGWGRGTGWWWVSPMGARWRCIFRSRVIWRRRVVSGRVIGTGRSMRSRMMMWSTWGSRVGSVRSRVRSRWVVVPSRWSVRMVGHVPIQGRRDVYGVL
eukprot:sb/3471788/